MEVQRSRKEVLEYVRPVPDGRCAAVAGALAVGDCAEGWRGGRCYTESLAPCLLVYLFSRGVASSLAHPGLQSSLQLWVLRFWCGSLFYRVGFWFGIGFGLQPTVGSIYN